METIKKRKPLRFVKALVFSGAVLTALMVGSPAHAVVGPPPPTTDANKTVTLNADGTYSCGPGYVLISPEKGCAPA